MDSVHPAGAGVAFVYSAYNVASSNCSRGPGHAGFS